MKNIAVMNVPYRKKKCLCIFEAPNVFEIVAVFTNDVQAEKFKRYISEYIGEQIENALSVYGLIEGETE